MNVGGEPRAAVQRGSVEFHGFDFSTPVSGASATFGELFSELLPESSAAAAPAAGGDLHGEITLGFEEALRGAVRQLTVTRLDACAVCGGSGVRPRGGERGCAACQGRGRRSGGAATWCSRRRASPAPVRDASGSGPAPPAAPRVRPP